MTKAERNLLLSRSLLNAQRQMDYHKLMASEMRRQNQCSGCAVCLELINRFEQGHLELVKTSEDLIEHLKGKLEML